ncbi:hypothetical protein E2C01_048287 [Portunus trituberculatus]|uniref:Uncharacterized protein n=1 Tax=Portunus trituberculatus TaxID=210409 RepID=A0A5B7GA67_PORTR|nr:hypothetical protein [Portunus trituberculatus]
MEEGTDEKRGGGGCGLEGVAWRVVGVSKNPARGRGEMASVFGQAASSTNVGRHLMTISVKTQQPEALGNTPTKLCPPSTAKCVVPPCPSKSRLLSEINIVKNSKCPPPARLAHLHTGTGGVSPEGAASPHILLRVVVNHRFRDTLSPTPASYCRLVSTQDISFPPLLPVITAPAM